VSIPVWDPLEKLGRGSFQGYCERWLKEGCGNGASLSTGALLG
jgi:hypothetical protein